MQITKTNGQINSSIDLFISKNISTITKQSTSRDATISRSGQRRLQRENHTVMAQIKLANPQERQMLERNCQLMISMINEYFVGIGGLRSSARNNAVRDTITQYLTSNGSPVAMEMLRDYERRGWANV